MRLLMTVVFVVPLLSAVAQSWGTVRGCDQAAGNQAARDGHAEEALDKLRACEYDPAATGETLWNLAVLYLWPGFSSFPSQEQRSVKFYKVLHRAAEKGNYHALVTLSSVHRTGDSLVGIPASEPTADCLLAVADDPANFSPGAVERCIQQNR